jgi:hypothetical protein
MSVGDSITCECNNCVDEEIKTVSARHAEAFEALEHLFVLSSKALVKLITQKLLSGLFCHI